MGEVLNFRILSQAFSEIAGRFKFANRTGKLFGGDRDLYQTLGYPLDLTPDHYWEAYERGGVLARVVDAMPKATWRGAGELIDDEESEELTQFETAWEELNTRLHVWPTFLRTDILAGLGRYSVLFIGAPGNVDTPLPKPLASKNIAYLQPYSERDARFSDVDLNRDEHHPRYGMPEFYNLGRTTIGSQRVLRVHWTRVVHVPDGLLDNQIYGLPRLKRVWNRFIDLEKITGGGAEAFWMRANQGTQFDLDKDLSVTPEALKTLQEDIDRYMHGMQRVLRTRGVTVTPLGSDVANIEPSADAILQQISGATGIPKRILLGSEMGELASTQDRNNWSERINDRRTEFAEPTVIRAFADRLILHGALPPPKNEKYVVRWPSIKDLSETEQADIANKLMTLNDHGQVVIVSDEVRGRAFGLPPLTDEQLTRVQQLSTAPPAPEEEEVEEDEDGEGFPPEDDDDEEDRAAGGPGSGHHGHAGRPGEVGGSGPGGGATIGKSVSEGLFTPEGRGASEASAKELANPRFQAAYARAQIAAQDPDASNFERSNPVAIARAEAESERWFAEVNPQGSDGHYREESGKYTKSRAQLHDDIIAHYESKFGAPQEKPVVVVTGGLAGAGKTAGLVSSLGKDYESKYVNVNSDDIKAMLPEFNGLNAGWVHEESDYVSKIAFAKAVAARQNLILDVTMKSIGELGGQPDLNGSLAQRVSALKNAGYEVRMQFTDVSIQTSIDSAMSRYISKGRFVPPAYIRGAQLKSGPYKTKNRQSFEALKGLADSWVRYERDFGKAPREVERGGK